MSKTAIEVITSVQRRRRWTAEEKERLVAASLEPGTGVSAVARQAGIHPSQLYGWRRQLCARAQPAANFAAVRIAAAPAPNGNTGLRHDRGRIRKRLAGTNYGSH
jgi:transposase